MSARKYSLLICFIPFPAVQISSPNPPSPTTTAPPSLISTHPPLIHQPLFYRALQSRWAKTHDLTFLSKNIWKKHILWFTIGSEWSASRNKGRGLFPPIWNTCSVKGDECIFCLLTFWNGVGEDLRWNSKPKLSLLLNVEKSLLPCPWLKAICIGVFTLWKRVNRVQCQILVIFASLNYKKTRRNWAVCCLWCHCWSFCLQALILLPFICKYLRLQNRFCHPVLPGTNFFCKYSILGPWPWWG